MKTTRQHRSISKRIRDSVTERDNDRCVKCGRYKNLELHHIIPAYMGGGESKENLITLCKNCHKEAPDNPVEFFKWASTSLPTHMDHSIQLTKIVIGLIAFNDEQLQKLNSLKKQYEFEGKKDFSENELFEWIEKFYKDMWKVYISNDVKNLSIFFDHNIPKKEEKSIKDKPIAPIKYNSIRGEEVQSTL